MVISIRVADFRATPENFQTLRELREDVLSADRRWHFLWEGDYTLVRCSSETSDAVQEWFADRDVETERLGGWQDPVRITAKYQAQFERLFHAQTELILETRDGDVVGVLERAIHCLINACLGRGDLHDESVYDHFHVELRSQAILLAELGLLEAWTSGLYEGQVLRETD